MFLSIVIPVWNDEKYLNECLDSCLDQDLSKDDYEIICLDDGSTDRTPEILQEYADRYSNIHVITKQHGIQYGSGREIGLAVAKGDYIWFVDHDDVVAPRAADELKETVLKNADYDRIEFPCYKFFDSLTEEERSYMAQGRMRQNYQFPPLDWVVWSSIIKRSFLRDNNISPSIPCSKEAAAFWEMEELRVWGADYILIDTCKDHGVRTFRLNQRPLYHYRVHSRSSMMDTSPEAVEKRARMRYNMALYRGYRAWVQKQKYFAERDANGKASAETAEKMVLKIRDAVSFLSMQLGYQWKAGIKRFVEKDIFLSRKPEEYPITFRKYWKRLSTKEKLLPHLLAYYFSFQKTGAKLYWYFSWPFRFRNNNRLLRRHREEKLRKRMHTVGLPSE